MKRVKFYLLFAIVFGISLACKQPEKKADTLSPNAEIQINSITTEKPIVYFVGYERHCPSCKSIERVAKSLVRKKYNHRVEYKALNLKNKEDKKIAESLNVDKKSLLVVFNNQKHDLTSIALKNHKNNPELLKQELREAINQYL